MENQETVSIILVEDDDGHVIHIPPLLYENQGSVVGV